MDPEKQTPIKTPKAVVETYAQDMAEVIEHDREGLVKKIIEGEEQRELEKKNLSPESQRNKMFMGLSAVLFVVGIFLIAYFAQNQAPKAVPVGEEITPLVFADRTVYQEIGGLKKQEIAQLLYNAALNSEVKSGGVQGMYLGVNKQVIGLRQALLLMSARFEPGDPALVSDQYMLGSVKIPPAEGTGFFILLKMRSPSDIFEPLRAWESKMFADLHGVFGISRTSETNYLFAKDFEDDIVENKNARILSDKEGQPVLMYVFADNNSVVITDSALAVREVMLRLGAKETKE